MRRTAAALLCASAGMVSAQEDPPQQQSPFWQPEVRKAIPVSKPSPEAQPNQNPAAPSQIPATPNRPLPTPTPMATPSRVPQPSSPAPPVREIPTAPAVPFDNPEWMKRVQPSPTPAESAPKPEPGFTPYRPQGRIEVAPSPQQSQPPPPPQQPQDESGDIRVSPTGATGDAATGDLERANAIYARKMYDYALPEYEKFVIAHPNAKGRDMALFRLAECHRNLGNMESARSGYEKLVMEFREGEFAGSGAYRLGEFLYGEGKYEPAAMQFEMAAKQSASDEIRLSAKYNLARCYDRLKKPAEAAKMYEEVVAVEKNNPYLQYARIALAESAAAAGRKEEALERFGKLAAGSAPAAVRAEAAVKAASLAAELGDKKKAIKLFSDALGASDSGEWQSVAFLGAMRLYYDLGDYKKVISMADKPPENLPDEAMAEMMMLWANSFRQTGNTKAAKAVYERVLIKYPDAAPQDARFYRLVSMYQLNDPDLLKETESFLKESTNPKQTAQVRLLQAEALFKDQKFADAGPIYAQLLNSDLSDEMKAKAFFKVGWCQAQTGNPAGAVKTYTDYIAKYPSSPTVPSALIQRGMANKDNKDYAAAMKDFDLLIEKYKGSEKELAMQQKALILGQQQDYKGMIAIFKQLLADYPKSTAAGQANFWIGWAAFEEKDYKAALENLQLARKLDPAQYGERSVLRIILCYYYLEDRAALVKTIADNKNVAVPVEITRWLGRKSFDEGDYASAERFLLPVMKDPKSAEPEVLIELAEAQIRQGRTSDATPVVTKYLESARDPRSRARGLQAQAAIAMAAKDYENANRLCDESLLLQPEGRLNAEGRLLAGEIAYSKGDYPEAARAFMTVAVLYDDASLTPRALRRAADAYKKSNNLMEAEKASKELQQRFPDFQKSAKVSREN